MTPEYILRKSLCRETHCGSNDPQVNLRMAASEIENLQFAGSYAEPGYTQPTKGILFANWNYFPRGIDQILENYGFAIEWQDEWSTCGECGRAVRQSADCYSWQPSFAIVNECELLCIDCLSKDAESYLQELEDNPRTALNLPSINPADYGYRMLQDNFENGLHPGQTDDPKKIFDELTTAGHSRILFQIDSVGQFDAQFSVWEHVPEETDDEL